MGRKISFVVLILIALFAGYSFYRDSHRGVTNQIVLYGNVDVRQVDLGFRVPGLVQALYFEEGDLIPPGTLMATLDKQPYNDQALQAAAKVESAKASLINAEKVLKRRQELISDGSISKEDLDNAQASYDMQIAALKEAEAGYSVALSNLNFTELFAPNEGTILTRVREVGAVVNPTEPVYTLSITSPVWIRAFCTEPELGLIYPGMTAQVTTDNPGGRVYTGKVGFISPVAEFTPKTVETTQLRTDLVYRLRIYVDNPDRGLRQGMPVTVTLNTTRDASERAL